MLTASQITTKAIEILESRMCLVWRQNNLAVRGRKFIGMKGLSDIIGFQKFTGVAVFCEVKAVGDKLSDDQILFLNGAKAAGCFCFLATEEDGKFILKNWEITH